MYLSALLFAGQREDELRVSSSGGFNPSVGSVGNDGAEGLRVGCMAKSPDVFDFFLGESECLGDIDVRGEGLDTRWIGNFVGEMILWGGRADC